MGPKSALIGDETKTLEFFLHLCTRNKKLEKVKLNREDFFNNGKLPQKMILKNHSIMSKNPSKTHWFRKSVSFERGSTAAPGNISSYESGERKPI